jgi:Flp pilus assembly protein protease CpaA
MWQWSVVTAAALLAAICDLRSRRIPNLLTGPLFAGGVCLAACVGGVGGVVDSLAGCILASLPYVILFIWAGGGAGDAKMMGAIGAWVGLKGGTIVLVCVALAGAIVAVIWAWRGGRMRRLAADLYAIVARAVCAAGGVAGWRNSSLRVATQPYPADAMPYGLAILMGMLTASAVVWFCRQ